MRAGGRAQAAPRIGIEVRRDLRGLPRSAVSVVTSWPVRSRYAVGPALTH